MFVVDRLVRTEVYNHGVTKAFFVIRNQNRPKSTFIKGVNIISPPGFNN